MINNIWGVVLTSVSTIVLMLGGKELLLPNLLKLIDWFRGNKNNAEDRKLDVTSEISKLKLTEVERYEKTFETLLNQINSLEEELKSYASELSELRNTILKLNGKLYEKTMIIADLQKHCCLVPDCKNRVACENKILNLIDNEIE